MVTAMIDDAVLETLFNYGGAIALVLLLIALPWALRADFKHWFGGK